jgi:hypothetical protein
LTTKKTTTTNGHKCSECDETFTTKSNLGRHRLHEHGIAGESKSALYRAAHGSNKRVKCPDCNKPIRPTGMANHRRMMHGIFAETHNEYTRKKNLPRPFPCPHCDVHAATVGGLNKHINAAHPRSELVKTSEAKPAALIATNGHHPETHTTPNGIPEAHDGAHRLEAVATLATGRIQQVIEGLAFTHDLPPRTLTSLVIRTLGQAAKIW